jgi:hypothetical protein
MERFFIYAKPNVRDVNPYTLNLYTSSNSLSSLNDLTISLAGKYFFSTRNIYLSGKYPNVFQSTAYYNPFSAISNLSATNPGFYAILVPSFTTFADTNLIFDIPEYPRYNTFVDVIVENEAGYGKLSTGSIRNYVSSWSGFTNVSLPSVSGIQITYI